MKAFKAYDIRGVWGNDLNSDIIYRTGYFLKKVLKAEKILIGRDIRNSSPEMHESLTKGLMDAGCMVYDAGTCTTPMVYWGTGKYDFDAGLMITASHNPKEYNGLKVSAKNVKPIAYDNGLKEVEGLIESGAMMPKIKGGSMQTFEIKSDYLEYLKSYSSFSPDIKVSIDFSCGMAGLFADSLFPHAEKINALPDGDFPAHEPNPLEVANQQQIIEQVIENKSDIGVIFDGDADRVMFIDEKGKFISPDLIIALLGHYFLKDKNKEYKVVQDIRTSKAVAEYLRQFNATVDIWRVGRAYGATRLKQVDGIYGGELAGHYYFRDFYYSDSGLLAAILVLNIVDGFRLKGIELSSLISTISPYFNTGEVNFKIQDKLAAMNAVRDYFYNDEKPQRYLDFDGYRLDFEDWWFNIRPSNTEPYLRFLAEAKSKRLLSEKTDVIYSILSRFE